MGKAKEDIARGGRIMAKKKVVVTDWEYADLRYEKEVLDHEDMR